MPIQKLPSDWSVARRGATPQVGVRVWFRAAPCTVCSRPSPERVGTFGPESSTGGRCEEGELPSALNKRVSASAQMFELGPSLPDLESADSQ